MQKSEMRFFRVQHHISPNSSQICLIFRAFLTNYDQIRTIHHLLVLIRDPWTKIYQKLILIIQSFMVRLKSQRSIFSSSFLPYRGCAVTMCVERLVRRSAVTPPPEAPKISERFWVRPGNELPQLCPQYTDHDKKMIDRSHLVMIMQSRSKNKTIPWRIRWDILLNTKKTTFLIYASTTMNRRVSGVEWHAEHVAVVLVKLDSKFGGYSTCVTVPLRIVNYLSIIHWFYWIAGFHCTRFHWGSSL